MAIIMGLLIRGLLTIIRGFLTAIIKGLLIIGFPAIIRGFLTIIKLTARDRDSRTRFPVA